MWPLDVVEISQNQEFLYEKQAVNQSQYRKNLDVVCQYIHVDAIFPKFIYTQLQRYHSFGLFFDKYFSSGRLRYLLDFFWHFYRVNGAQP